MNCNTWIMTTTTNNNNKNLECKTHSPELDVADGMVDFRLLDPLSSSSFIVDEFNVYIFIWCFSCCCYCYCDAVSILTAHVKLVHGKAKKTYKRALYQQKHIKQKQAHRNVWGSNHLYSFDKKNVDSRNMMARKQPSAFVSHYWVFFLLARRYVCAI